MAGYKSYTDQELISSLKSGDELAFENLYLRYWEKMFYFAIQKTGDIMDAENVVQDVFISLWNRRSSLNITSELSHYLIVSVKYRIIKLFEKQRNQRLHEEQSLAAYDILDDSTQQYLNFEELRSRLEEFICKLPEKSAVIYRMSRQEDVSHKEIALKLGISEDAVNSDLKRTKKKLAVNLKSFLHTVLL